MDSPWQRTKSLLLAANSVSHVDSCFRRLTTTMQRFGHGQRAAAKLTADRARWHFAGNAPRLTWAA
jgi:hypothetical protein